jgi:hypothetical protein
MYTNATLLRRNYVKLSLSDREAALIDALCEYSGEQKATFLRELILRKAEEVLHGGNSVHDPRQFGAAA